MRIAGTVVYLPVCDQMQSVFFKYHSYIYCRMVCSVSCFSLFSCSYHPMTRRNIIGGQDLLGHQQSASTISLEYNCHEVSSSENGSVIHRHRGALARERARPSCSWTRQSGRIGKLLFRNGFKWGSDPKWELYHMYITIMLPVRGKA